MRGVVRQQQLLHGCLATFSGGLKPAWTIGNRGHLHCRRLRKDRGLTQTPDTDA